MKNPEGDGFSPISLDITYLLKKITCQVGALTRGMAEEWRYEPARNRLQKAEQPRR